MTTSRAVLVKDHTSCFCRLLAVIRHATYLTGVLEPVVRTDLEEVVAGAAGVTAASRPETLDGRLKA